METVQQHEWAPGGDSHFHHCAHCSMMRIGNRIRKIFTYHKNGMTYPLNGEEPPCITRPEQAKEKAPD